VAYGDIRVTPLNGEKDLYFQVRNLRFIDSFLFVSTSLDNLMSLLGREKFAHTTKFLRRQSSLCKERLSLLVHDRAREIRGNELPPIEAFYNTLEDEPYPPKNYDRARKISAHYDIKTMQDYRDHYLLFDILLLADVFENFRNSIYKQHCLDLSTL